MSSRSIRARGGHAVCPRRVTAYDDNVAPAGFEDQFSVVTHTAAGPQIHCLGGLVFADQHPDLRMADGQRRGDRHQGPPDRCGKSNDPDDPGGIRVRIQIEPSRFDRGQDGDRVFGQPAAGRGQPDPAAVRFDQPGVQVTACAGICCYTDEVVTATSSATSFMAPSRTSWWRNSNRRVSTWTIMHD